ncbi:MAG: carcinine hydrolase/isopenicillin-N N-acyltransferase family protein [Mediterranea sp.]|jgi:hypothetical protein|nr:carcinine hydrolase/isopenicillin-N N-acyltransferase family protein [Mediterranea sp.]
MKKYTLLLLCILPVLCAETANACTAAVISGKITPDGRPMLWKNRDTSDLLNGVRYIKGEKYGFVAVTGYAENPRTVWMGTNETGFAVMNTISYNLTEEEGEGSARQNGVLMKRALGICTTVADFRHYLDTLSRPMNVRTNYGVIDAQGNGSFFEVNSTTYKEYDVNDPAAAPHGFIVRTNYSMSGKLNEGAGYVRYQEAQEKLFTVSATREITPQWLFSNLSRSFHNPLLGIDLKDGRFNKPHTSGWFVEQDFVARRSSSCAVVIQGVRPDEDASFTTMWTVIGYPPVTPAIPVWVKGAEKKLPRLLTIENGCPLCDAADGIRRKVYSYSRGMNTENYFRWELLFNRNGNGYMQQAEELETEMFGTLYGRIDGWRKNKSLPEDEAHKLYGDCDTLVGKNGAYLQEPPPDGKTNAFVWLFAD